MASKRAPVFLALILLNANDADGESDRYPFPRKGTEPLWRCTGTVWLTETWRETDRSGCPVDQPWPPCGARASRGAFVMLINAPGRYWGPQHVSP